jgi:hypothetical protein
MTHSEYCQWVAFLNMEDFRVSRMEFYLARIAFVLLKANGDKKTKWKDMFLDDPYDPKQDKEPSQDELWSKMNAWLGTFERAGKVKREAR